MHNYDVEINQNINSSYHTYNLLEKYSNNILDVRCYNFPQNPIFSERFNSITQNLIKSEELFIVMKKFIETNFPEFKRLHQQLFTGYAGKADTMFAALFQKK